MRVLALWIALILAAAVSASADWNVRDFGAVADETTDCTAAFQKALDEAGKAGGGVVNVPAGKYRIDGNLAVPAAVTLQGTFRVPPNCGGGEDFQGTTLLAYAGRGSEEGKPFINLAGDAAVVAGLIIYYPEWKRSDVPPIPYPPCIASSETANVGVLDCLLVNPYEGIKLVRAHRHLVRNVYGYPIKRGLFVDQCYDIGRVENIHFWPFHTAYRIEDPFTKWVNTQGVCMEFARTDWQYVTNTFCFGYGVGYKFSAYEHGGCNGNFLGIGADCCERAILVEESQGAGLLITNGEFVGRWGSKEAVCIEIAEKSRGKVSLSNCSFWGPIERCVWLRSPSCQFTAIGCNFVDWDKSGSGWPAIQIDAGRAIVQGSTFGEGSLHVAVGAKAASCILMGNQALDGFAIQNAAGKRTQSVANETSAVVWTDKAKSHYKVTIGEDGDKAFLSKWHDRESSTERGKRSTWRWSKDLSQMMLPIVPGKAYTLTFAADIPEVALAKEAGIYLDGKRLAAITKAGTLTLTAQIPAQETDRVTLDLRVRGWIPAEVEAGSMDGRTLGVIGRSITMRAKSAPAPVFDANTGEWSE